MRMVKFKSRRFGHDMDGYEINIDADSVRIVKDVSGPNGYGHPVKWSLVTIAGVSEPIGVAYDAETAISMLELRGAACPTK